MEQVVFSGALKNGMKVDLLEASSFSGNTEVALKIGGQLVNVVSVAGKRRGETIECKTIETCVVKIHKPATEAPPADKPRTPPTLSDVVPGK
jgi:hypothetical protein